MKILKRELIAILLAIMASGAVQLEGANPAPGTDAQALLQQRFAGGARIRKGLADAAEQARIAEHSRLAGLAPSGNIAGIKTQITTITGEIKTQRDAIAAKITSINAEFTQKIEQTKTAALAAINQAKAKAETAEQEKVAEVARITQEKDQEITDLKARQAAVVHQLEGELTTTVADLTTEKDALEKLVTDLNASIGGASAALDALKTAVTDAAGAPAGPGRPAGPPAGPPNEEEAARKIQALRRGGLIRQQPVLPIAQSVGRVVDDAWSNEGALKNRIARLLSGRGVIATLTANDLGTGTNPQGVLEGIKQLLNTGTAQEKTDRTETIRLAILKARVKQVLASLKSPNAYGETSEAVKKDVNAGIDAAIQVNQITTAAINNILENQPAKNAVSLALTPITGPPIP
jgi:hypothetical protein